MAPDESGSLERYHHLVNRRRADLEIALHVDFSRGAPVQPGIGIDKCQYWPVTSLTFTIPTSSESGSSLATCQHIRPVRSSRLQRMSDVWKPRPKFMSKSASAQTRSPSRSVILKWNHHGNCSDLKCSRPRSRSVVTDIQILVVVRQPSSQQPKRSYSGERYY